MNAPVDAGMLKKHDGPEGQTVEVSYPAAADLADVLDWLAAQFIHVPQREQVHAARSVVGQMLSGTAPSSPMRVTTPPRVTSRPASDGSVTVKSFSGNSPVLVTV